MNTNLRFEIFLEKANTKLDSIIELVKDMPQMNDQLSAIEKLLDQIDASIVSIKDWQF